MASQCTPEPVSLGEALSRAFDEMIREADTEKRLLRAAAADCERRIDRLRTLRAACVAPTTPETHQ